jgi:dipeptidyl aminopeptidase/acylaminoacyl peptidase
VTAGKKTLFKRFDALAILTIAVSSLLILITIGSGDRSSAHVSNFSWYDRQISSSERQFTIDFNRPIDRLQVERNLKIQPPLTGKISWAGNRLFYTLTEIPLAETTYQIKLGESKTIALFNSTFQTRDRIFAYLGIETEERGKIVLYNYTQKQKTILTPKDLVVTDFKVVADGAKIVFFAYDSNDLERGLDRLQLYTVTTGIAASRLGSIQKIIDAKDYQNIDFDLAVDGKTIVVERTSRKNLSDTSLWSIVEGKEPHSLGIIGNNFRISPDGEKLAITQNLGVTLISLKSQDDRPQFFKDYSEIIGFSPDNKDLLLVKYNLDYSRSLFLVSLTNKERLTEIFKSFSLIFNCQFEPRKKQTIYCVKNDLTVDNGQYHQLPFLIAINLQNKQSFPLLSLPNSQDVRLTISPDGALLLFDQTIGSSIGKIQTIANGNLWRLPLLDIEATGKTAPPQQLITGFHPQWLP